MRNARMFAMSSLALVVIATSCGKRDFSFPSTTSSTAASGGAGGAMMASTASGEGGDLSIAAVTANNTSTSIAGTGGAGGAGCLSESYEGKKKPLDVIVLLDRSISMLGSPWAGATGALKTFINNPRNVDTSLGLDFYPRTDLPADCPLTSYNPLQIPLEVLPAGASKLAAAIDKTEPKGYDTPLHSAVYGALQDATTYQDDHPDHKVAMVLASDGGANSCNTKIDDIAAAMKTAYDYNGVLTSSSRSMPETPSISTC
ncbi:MAG: VWA domain-containing protein [Deltaproteobacteria bacterium]|nr:VWA domain-containing protein [Deltaproteobacteria bacterium]